MSDLLTHYLDPETRLMPCLDEDPGYITRRPHEVTCGICRAWVDQDVERIAETYDRQRKEWLEFYKANNPQVEFVGTVDEAFAYAEKRNTFTKHDAGKPRIDLVPSEAIRAIARAFTIGEVKYGFENWKRCTDWKRVYAAAMRHMLAWNDGVLTDDESGLSHLDHALCNIAMLAWAAAQQTKTPPV